MDANEKIVCDLFKVKGSEYIPKQRLVNSLATLNRDYEQLYLELFEVCPDHKRFAHWTPEVKERTIEMIKNLRAQQKAALPKGKSLWARVRDWAAEWSKGFAIGY
jgi:hypothetical protein